MLYIIESDINAIISINVNKVRELLFEENIGIIKIVVLILIDAKCNIDIDISTEYQLAVKLCLDYNNNNKSTRTVKCLTYFTKEEKLIDLIYTLCNNKEIIYKMLNYNDILSKESKNLLIDFAHKKFEVDEEISREYIVNNNILEEIKSIFYHCYYCLGKISTFSYPSSSYTFVIGESISIKPEYDGLDCEFTINPNLPDNIEFNEETGEINGVAKSQMENTEYTIKISNMWNEFYFKLSIEFINIVFIDNKNSDIALEDIKYAEITDEGKLVTQIEDMKFSRRWLNLKMNEGVYHIKYKFNCKDKNNKFMVGISNSGTCCGDVIYIKSKKCLYSNEECDSKRVGGLLCTIVNENPAIYGHGDGSIYEVIVDFKKKEFLIKHNKKDPILIAKDFSPPLYSFISLYYKYTSVRLISIIHDI